LLIKEFSTIVKTLAGDRLACFRLAQEVAEGYLGRLLEENL